MADGPVLRIPDEPPAGTLVQEVASATRWLHCERMGLGPDAPRWMQLDAPAPHWATWPWVMKFAAPAGVKVISTDAWTDLLAGNGEAPSGR